MEERRERENHKAAEDREHKRHIAEEADLKKRLDKIIAESVVMKYPRCDADKYAVVVEFSPEVFTSRYWTRPDFELLAEQVSRHVYGEIVTARFIGKSNHEWIQGRMAESLHTRPPFPGYFAAAPISPPPAPAGGTP